MSGAAQSREGRGVLANVLPVLRYFGAIVWRHRRSYFLVVAGDAVLTGCGPFVNIVVPRFIIDELLGQRRVSVLVALVALLAGGNLAVQLLGNVRDYLQANARSFFDRKLEELLARQAMRMDFQYTESAEVLTQLEKAKTGVSWYSGGIGGLGQNVVAIGAGAIQLAGTLYIMLLLSPWLVAVMLGVVALGLVLTSEQQRAHVRFMKDLVGINRRFGYVFSLLKNFAYGKDIRLYEADGLILDRVDHYIRQEWGVEMRRSAVANRFAIMRTTLGGAQQALLYGYLGIRALAGAITIGDLQMLIAAAGAFVQGLNSVLEQVIDLGKNGEFMNEYRAFMRLPAAKAEGRAEPPAAVGGHHFAFRGVSFRYPGSEHTALCDVSLEIPAGQRLAVVGPNGAGKTTFVKLLTRLYDPTSGEALLGDRDIRQFDGEAYARTFSVVFQDFKLLACSVRDNVTLGARADDTSLWHALDAAGLAERVRALPRGADTAVYRTFEEDGVELSGGESQKLAIARAVYRDAPVVILDEPTAALDPESEYQVYRHFDELIRGRTAIYISHRLSSCRFADRIAVFDGGRIVEHGTHDELVERGGLYARLWNAQAQWYR